MDNNSVSLTSKVSACGRANESTRVDQLFIDRLAPVYATEDVVETNKSGNKKSSNACCCRKFWSRTRVVNKVLNSTGRFNFTIARLVGVNMEQIYLDIALRTRCLDDIIDKHIQSIKQIVLLACGGDFRPYRLTCLSSLASPADLTFFLIDVPHVLDYRQKCIEKLDPPAPALCKVVEIGCDLVNPEWTRMLCEAGYLMDQPTLFVAEGFFHYLTKEQVGSLFEKLRKLTISTHAYIAFDLVSTDFQSRSRRTADGGLFQFAVDRVEDVQQIFTEFGCSDIQTQSFQDLGKKYNRPVAPDRSFIVEAKLEPLRL